MEIEAKFVVPTGQVAQRLRELQRVADFSLGTSTRVVLRDTFFDTPHQDLVSSRHVLRIRKRSDGRMFLTFKAPAHQDAAIHKRPETEVPLALARTPRLLHVNELPPRIRTLVAPLVAEKLLLPLFSISQTREIRGVRNGRNVIAEWSLDKVRFRAGVRKQEFSELEIELKKTGTEGELARIVGWLEQTYGLEAAQESKFARGLAFMRRNY